MRLIYPIIFILLSPCLLFSQSFSSTTSGAIPDGTGTASNPYSPQAGPEVCFPITVSGVGTINNSLGLSKVCLTISHTYTGDLHIRLKSPDGTIIPLALEVVNTSKSNFTNTCFTMAAALSINDQLANNPYSGNFIPMGNLGWFNNGQNANGTWNLCVEDVFSGDVGTFNSCTLTFSNNPPPLPVISGCGGNQSAGNQCNTATPICNLNGYCGNTSSLYSPNYWQELEIAFCGSIENNSFIQFVASASNISLNVNVSNSQYFASTGSTLNAGIQFMVFSGGCGSGAVTSYGCNNQMLPGNNVVTATGLTPGNTYYLMIDGFAGDVCDYNVTVNSGVNVFTISPSSPSICTPSPGVTIGASGGNGTYTWNPATGLNTTTGPTVIANPATTTTYTVTTGAIGSLNCPLTKNVTVTVNAKPVVTAPGVICLGNTGTLTPTTGGTWASSNTAVATVTNTGVITTVSAGSVTFTFTDAVTGCAATTNAVTIGSGITPTFNAITPICKGSIAPVLPSTSTNGIVGTWSPATVNNNATGTYTFTPNAGQCSTTTTTLTVTVNTPIVPTFNAIPSICSGTVAPVLPTTSTNGIVGTWSPAMVSNTTTATYTFTPIASACATTTTAIVTVSIAPNINLGPDLTLCEGDIRTLNATTLNASYLWQDGSSLPTFTITSSGTYFVKVSVGSCDAMDTVIAVYNLKPQFSLGADKPICPGFTFDLDAQLSGPGISYLWQDGSTKQTFTVSQIGTYFVDVTNNCGTTRGQVNVVDGVCKVYMPSAFTPNGDGTNDIYKAAGGIGVTEYSLIIYNRWGQRMFETKNILQGWDGTVNGTPQQTGSYVYNVVYKDPVTKEEITLKGTFVLIR